MPEEQPVDDLRNHVVWRGVRPPGQVRHLRQGAQLHRLDREDHRQGGEESTVGFIPTLYLVYDADYRYITVE